MAIDLRNTVGSMCEYLEHEGVELLIIARKDDVLMVGFTDTKDMDVLVMAAMSQVDPVKRAVESATDMMEQIKNATKNIKDNE